MITDREHREIFTIVDKFGGENKQELRSNIISLLINHDKVLKNKALKLIENI